MTSAMAQALTRLRNGEHLHAVPGPFGWDLVFYNEYYVTGGLSRSTLSRLVRDGYIREVKRGPCDYEWVLTGK